MKHFRQLLKKRELTHLRLAGIWLVLFTLLFGGVGTYLIHSGHAASGIPLAGMNMEPSMRPWRYAGANPDSWWDQCDTSWQTWVPQEVAFAKQLGVTTIRLEFPWALLEPQNGVYDWTRADYIVNQVASAGIQLQPIVVYTPPWSNGQAAGPPASATDYPNFLTALVGRYKSSVHYWEIWNEPDLGSYWNGSAQDYDNLLLIPGYQAIKAVDPTAQVILGGPSGEDMPWINGVYQYGGGHSFDIFAFHEYSGANVAVTDANDYRTFLNGQGQTSIPIWMGETGYSEGDTNDPVQQQWLQTVFSSNDPVAMVQWYNLRDDNPMDGCGLVAKNEYYGLVYHDDVTIKNGFYTLQSIIQGSSTTPTVSLSATPPTISQGGSSTLTWSSTNASSCTASGGWSGGQALSGSLAVSPTSTTTYTLTCTGLGGSSSANATVTIGTSGGVPGDCNGDGHVTIIDLSILLSHYATNYPACDFNNDGVVNILDLSILLSHYGT